MTKILAPKEDTAFVNLIEKLTSSYQVSMSILKSDDLTELFTEINTEKDVQNLNITKFRVLFLIKEIYQNFSLFRNENIVTGFNNLGFSNSELQWAFDINELLSRFKIMIDSGIVESINTTEITKIIYFYSCVNIDIALINKFKVVDRNDKIVINTNRIKAALQNITQKNKYRDNVQHLFESNEFDVIWEELKKEELMHEKLGISMEKYFKTILTKTDQILIPIFTEHIVFKNTDHLGNKVSMNKKYQIAYPLFQYLMPNKDNWYKDELEYKKSNDKSGYTFEMIMAKRMERFIKKDKPKRYR
jgi:hypothetical protein